MKKCLMIQTKDHKKFFTYEKNLPQLIEFSKVFNAEISTVQILNDNAILDLEELAPALCEKNMPSPNDYKIIEVKVKCKKKNNFANRAEKIQKQISNMLTKGKMVSLQELMKKYSKYKLTKACLCNHFRKTRENLTLQGHKIIKIGGGKYKCSAAVL